MTRVVEGNGLPGGVHALRIRGIPQRAGVQERIEYV